MKDIRSVENLKDVFSLLTQPEDGFLLYRLSVDNDNARRLLTLLLRHCTCSQKGCAMTHDLSWVYSFDFGSYFDTLLSISEKSCHLNFFDLKTANVSINSPHDGKRVTSIFSVQSSDLSSLTFTQTSNFLNFSSVNACYLKCTPAFVSKLPHRFVDRNSDACAFDYKKFSYPSSMVSIFGDPDNPQYFDLSGSQLFVKKSVLQKSIQEAVLPPSASLTAEFDAEVVRLLSSADSADSNEFFSFSDFINWSIFIWFIVLIIIIWKFWHTIYKALSALFSKKK